jgi:transaldolase
MVQPLESLIASGTKVWLDSVDPDEVAKNRVWGITGATSNPIIVMDLIRSGRFDHDLERYFAEGLDDDGVAWALTDLLVSRAEAVFRPVWEETHGNDGYVSFELDPLLEDPDAPLTLELRRQKYIELGRKWSAGHPNRMIKIPATPAGIAALEQLTADGVVINVTLTFSPRQYAAARDAIWRGAAQRAKDKPLKSVYSIFVSRVDTYTQEHAKGLTPAHRPGRSPPMCRRGNTRRPLPARTSKRTHREPMRRSRAATWYFTAT